MSSKAEPKRIEERANRTDEGTMSSGIGKVTTSQTLKGLRSQTRKPRVLIVDDSREIREYLSKLLEKHFSVTTAVDGRACINKASADPPNCILTDVIMPHLNGIDTIKLLRRDPKLGHIPIIAMSAYGNWGVAKAREAGATIVMVKPLEPDDVIENIRKLVAESPVR